MNASDYDKYGTPWWVSIDLSGALNVDVAIPEATVATTILKDTFGEDSNWSYRATHNRLVLTSISWNCYSTVGAGAGADIQIVDRINPAPGVNTTITAYRIRTPAINTETRNSIECFIPLSPGEHYLSTPITGAKIRVAAVGSGRVGTLLLQGFHSTYSWGRASNSTPGDPVNF